jgi:hypothetical protein
VDEPPLLVLGVLLSGRTGRLYKSLVLDQKIANSAAAGQNGMKYEGLFELTGVAKPGSTPEAVEQALYKEIEKLQKEKVEDRELQKVKNQFAADNYRRLEVRELLMQQILLADSNRGWQSFNEDPKRIAAVTADDVQRVANLYFKPENRAVALYYTKKAEGGADDPMLAGLSESNKAKVLQFKASLAAMPLDQAKIAHKNMQTQMRYLSQEAKEFFETLSKLLQEKIEKGGGK